MIFLKPLDRKTFDKTFFFSLLLMTMGRCGSILDTFLSISDIYGDLTQHVPVYIWSLTTSLTDQKSFLSSGALIDYCRQQQPLSLSILLYPLDIVHIYDNNRISVGRPVYFFFIVAAHE